MPKNKKPQGGRPARNFDPSYAKSSSKKPGSRSAGHRGYRPEEADAPAKTRWSRDERVAAGRTPHRAEREGARSATTARLAERAFDQRPAAPRRPWRPFLRP